MDGSGFPTKEKNILDVGGSSIYCSLYTTVICVLLYSGSPVKFYKIIMNQEKKTKSYLEWMLYINSIHYGNPAELDKGIAKDLSYNLFIRN